jgi:hypothetical protein
VCKLEDRRRPGAADVEDLAARLGRAHRRTIPSTVSETYVNVRTCWRTVDLHDVAVEQDLDERRLRTAHQLGWFLGRRSRRSAGA